MRTVVGFGAGGHAKSVIEILRASGVVVAGLLDPRPEVWGQQWAGATVLGDEGLLDWLQRQGVQGFFVGIGGTRDNRARRRLYETALARGLSPATVQHPRACLSPDARLGAGVQLMAGSLVGSDVVLASHCLVNSGAIVEHDCFVGEHAHVASGARLAYGVHVGAGAHIGIGATVREGVRIGEYAIVGAGAVVLRDVPARATVVGVPAKTLRVERPVLDA